jgi:hypothetical protein
MMEGAATRPLPSPWRATEKSGGVRESSPGLVEALRILALAITNWYQQPNDLSVPDELDERTADDAANLMIQAEREAVAHMREAAHALQTAADYLASLPEGPDPHQ